MKIIILGGTTEARQLAERLSSAVGFDVMLSLAGRTAQPKLPPVPHRVGGFGGVSGLSAFIKDNSVDVVVDATHPFAAQISRNAFEACNLCGCKRLGLMRPEWMQQVGDDWVCVDDLEGAVTALPDEEVSVFLSVGRQSLEPFAAKPQHRYLIRVIDPPVIPGAMTRVDVVQGMGPFDVGEECELMRTRGVRFLVTKNSGATATAAKIAAAREIGVRVVMIKRPPRPEGPWFETVDEVVERLHQYQDSLAKRSV